MGIDINMARDVARYVGLLLMLVLDLIHIYVTS